MTGSLGSLDGEPQLRRRVQDRHRLRDVRATHPQPPRETGAVADGRVGDGLAEGQSTRQNAYADSRRCLRSGLRTSSRPIPANNEDRNRPVIDVRGS